MKNRFLSLRALVLLLACLIPMSCLVESEGELRVFSIDLGKFALDSGYLVVYLADTAGARQDDLYAGPVPKEKTLRLDAPGYGGEEAILVLQEYLLLASQGGDTLPDIENLLRENRLRLMREYRLLVRQGDTARLLPSTPLPMPSRPLPADSAKDIALDTELRWLLGATPLPNPRAQVRFGTVNPPPLVSSSSMQGDSGLFLGGRLQPETEYFWQVTSIRGQESRPGPVWRFRTRPAPPESLSYPECDDCHLGRSLTLKPRYAGGGHVQYSVDPPLPEGLALDAGTGVIEGKPLAYPDTAGYTIRAANVSGAATFVLHPTIRPRLLEVDVSGMAIGTGRVLATLWRPDSTFLDTLWAGPGPASNTLRKEVPAYDGEEASVLVQVFRDTLIGGVTRELLTDEKRLRIWLSRGIAVVDSTRALEAPVLLSPADGASGLDTAIDLAWEPGTALQPPPLAELRFGLANPPGMVASGLVGPRSSRLSALPDTDYFWQVVNVRAGVRSASPVRRFRTRLLPPSSLRYPADSVFHVGGADTLRPAYQGGGRVRYAAEPPLPEGFALDSLTGVLVASPRAEASPGDYLIRARNAAGSVAASLRFRVDSRLHRLEIPDSLRRGDSLSILLADPSGRVLRSLWDGAPPPASLAFSLGHDDGSEAHLLYRSFRGGVLLLELRYRLLGGVIERLPPAVPGAPSLPLPVSGALDQDTLLALAWSQDSLPGPAPLWRLRFGPANPPPVLFDSLREPRAALPPLLPDTLYRWSVTALRAGAEAQGPSWSFRTRPAPPRQLLYPDSNLLRLGYPASVAPVYAGGTRARYRVEPALPPGLSLDSLTGRLSGTPTGTAPEAAYAVTAANVSGSVRAEFRLRVDWRLVEVALPEESRGADSVVARLLDAQGGAVDTLWDGPMPADLRVGASTPRYDGSEAGLLVLAFRRGVLVREYRYRIRGPFGAAEALPLGSLPAPANLSPHDTAQAADTSLVLAWRSGVSDPPPLSRLYLGTSFPPPLYADSVRGDSLPVAGLSLDTRYYWRVETLRASRSALGALASFRTRPAAPRSLAYPMQDTLLPLDEGFSIRPTWKGGSGTFRIEPASLPQGWGFDPATGALYGTALATDPPQDYAVTLSNVSGSATTRFRLGVGYRVVDFVLPDTARRCDSLSVMLTDNWSYYMILGTLWQGPPPGDLRIRQEVPDYQGGDARVLIQGFLRGEVIWESIRRLDASQRIFETYPLPEMSPPMLFSPLENYDSDVPVVKLMWYMGGSQIRPDPVHRVYFGLTNPPPLLKDSVVEPELLVPTNLPDTVYYWRVEAIRLGDTVSTPVGRFRSYYPLTRSITYPGADSVYARGAPMRLEPAITGRPGYAYTFTSSNAMPPGVDLDPHTGIISGIPNGPAPTLEHRITDGNFLTTSLRFRVADDGDTTVHRVSSWELEETGNNVVVDSSGNGFHGTHNASTWTDGVRGRAMRFDDTTFAVFQARGALQVAGFTLSIWFKPDDLGNIQVLSEYSVPMDNCGIGCHINTSGWGEVLPGAIACNLRPSDAAPWQDGSVRERNNMVTAGGLVRAGEWNHMAYTFNPRTWKAVIYVNGMPAATRILGANFTPLTKGRLYLGMRPPDIRDFLWNIGFKGSMDHVEIFDGEVGAEAILEMYQSLKPH